MTDLKERLLAEAEMFLSQAVILESDSPTAKLMTVAAARIADLEAEVERLRDALLGIALTDRYRRYPKQHEDGGVRGQSGLRAVRVLTGQHGSYLNDEDVQRLDKEARAALNPTGGAG